MPLPDSAVGAHVIHVARVLVRESARRLGWTIVLTAFVVGVPLGLWAAVGNPLPTGLPSAGELRIALERGAISEHSLLKVLSLVCWIAWVQLLAVTARELVLLAHSGRGKPRAPLGRRESGPGSRVQTVDRGGQLADEESERPRFFHSRKGRSRTWGWRTNPSLPRAVSERPDDHHAPSDRNLGDPPNATTAGSLPTTAGGADDPSARSRPPRETDVSAAASRLVGRLLSSDPMRRLPWGRLRAEAVAHGPGPAAVAREIPDGALRPALVSLGRAIAAQDNVDSRPRLVQLRRDRVEVALSAPVLEAAAGWHAEASGSVWILQPLPERAPNSGETAADPCPLLVPIGRPEDTGQVYLDLEAEGLVSVTGDDEPVRALAECLLAALAETSPSITVIADSPHPPISFGAEVVPWSAVAERLVADPRGDAPTMDPNAFLARVRDPGDAEKPAPSLVVCLGRAPGGGFRELCALARSGQSRITVLTVGDHVPGATRVRAVGDTITIEDLELRGGPHRASSVGPHEHSPVHVAPAADDLDAGSGSHDRPHQPRPRLSAGQPPYPAEHAVDSEPEPSRCLEVPTASGEPYEDPEWEILVRCLGEIRVEDTAELLSTKKTAVVAYVALHGPISADQIEDAIWSEPMKSRRRRLVITLSQCRAALGAEHLPASTDGRYEVGPGVCTDLELFERRVAHADDQDPKAAVDTLRGALALVTGPVFTYRNADRASFVWVDLTNLISMWEPRVIDAAERLAQLCLEIGNPLGAVWAAKQGLLAAPIDTRLTESLMRAHSSAGSREAAELVYRSHAAVLGDLGIDEVAESTRALRQRIHDGSTP